MPKNVDTDLHEPQEEAPSTRPRSPLHNLFLSHSWSKDLRGRSTHDRARILRDELRKLGWKLWFDEDQLLLGCHIDSKMAEGIRNSDAICVVITRSYVEKVNSCEGNCAKEWNFAQAINKKILPIIFEQEMLDIKAWPPGVMTMNLANTFYVDCSCDDLRACAKRLSAMLCLLGLQPRLRRSISWPTWKVTERVLEKATEKAARGTSGMQRSRSMRSVRTMIRI